LKKNNAYAEYFSNEIVTFQIIQSKDLLNKSPNIAEYIGFVLNDSGPYFGSIIIKFYALGDLAEYCRDLNNSNYRELNENELLHDPIQLKIKKSNEISLLVDLAKQIAEGL